MIYVSSACSSKKNIREAIEELAQLGIKNIELTGGTIYYQDYEKDILRLKEEYNLNYLVHNYFPPPQESFVLNLASLNNDIYQKSLNHCLKAIFLSKKLGAKKLGFHAGFLIDVSVREIGKKITASGLFERKQSLSRFRDAWLILQEKAAPDLILYLENNVLSYSNYQSFNQVNPLLMSNYEGYVELKEIIDFNLLLDVAHLKVSCNSLGLNFEDELSKMLPLSNYVHLSDNDGKHDQNKGFNKNSELLQVLKQYDFDGKTITLEIYNNANNINQDYLIVAEALKVNED